VIAETEFWRLIDQSREAVGGDLYEHGTALARSLEGRSREDLQAFARLFDVFKWEAYRWDIWGAGYLLAGGMREGSFEAFRAWLISRGQRIYEIAIRDPDALAEAVPRDVEEFESEGLWLAARSVYEDAFGEEMPIEIFDDVPMRLGPRVSHGPKKTSRRDSRACGVERTISDAQAPILGGRPKCAGGYGGTGKLANPSKSACSSGASRPAGVKLCSSHGC